ncbi:MAG: hypothetical protein EOM59_20805 [Clostridia bacterium]|nr:hypothetical protein [Clostridia bacterium]
MDLTTAMTIGGYLLGIGVIYGVLKTKIDNLTNQKQACDKRFDTIERNHTDAIDGIREEVKSIANTLNQLVGKIDLFFQIYNKDNHNE